MKYKKKIFWDEFESFDDLEYDDEEAFEEANYAQLEYIKDKMDVQLENSIIVFADVGRWNGRRNGFKVISSGNIKDIFHSFESSSQSFLKFYCNGNNICCDEEHHDGVNHYVFRELKEPDYIADNIYWFDKSGSFSKSKISRKTKSLCSYFVEAGLL